MKKSRINVICSLLILITYSMNAKEVHEWAKMGDVDKIKLYVEDDGDLNMQDNDRRTPLHYIAGYGQYAVLAYLFDLDDVEIEINPLDSDSRTPLHYACCIEDMYLQDFGFLIVSKLIKKGALVNAQDDNLYTPLHFAVLSNQYDVAFELLKNKANPNYCTKKGQTVLHLAAIVGDKKMVNLLLAFKAQGDVIDKSGLSPRGQAISHGNLDIVSLL